MKTKTRVFRITFKDKHAADTRRNMAGLAKGLVESQYAFRFSPRSGGSFVASCSTADIVHFTDVVLAYCAELEEVKARA